MGPLVDDVDEFKRRFGVRVSTGYGMTEIGAPLRPRAAPGQRVELRAAPSRVPRLRGAGRRRVRPRPRAQQVGELIVRTAEPWTMNAGYFNMPAETAAAWRNGWFHTGDAFTYDDDGNYYFVDRIKDAIRRRGENISSFEVEAYVARHPGVQEVAAVAVPAEHTEDEVKVVIVPQARRHDRPPRN